jgi:hypothetical protein
MKRNITFSEELKELQKMKEEMDRLWNSLLEQSLGMKEEELWQWYERLPKFEGGWKKEPELEVE